MEQEALRDWERKALDMLASHAGTYHKVVEDQVRRCIAVSREHTGAGFYTTLCVKGNAALLPEGVTIDGVWGRLRGLEHNVGFVLFSARGLVSVLEGFANADDTWPVDEPQLVDCWIGP
jgi:hypothetical protein